MTETSQPIYRFVIERNVPIPMRDGTILRAEMYRPQPEGRYPAIVERVPYPLSDRCRANGEFFASRGYVFLGQNVRGALASDGVFRPLRDDAWGANRDGYDTIEWIAAQPWCDGNVGMVDGSYSGFTQYMLLPARPPHLRAIFAREGGSDPYRDWAFRGGAYCLKLNLDWALTNVARFLRQKSSAPESDSALQRLEAALKEEESWFWHLPLKSCPPLEGLAPWYFEDLEHPSDGPYWWPINLSHVWNQVDTPAVHLGGWFDVFLGGTLRSFEGIQKHGRTERCRQSQRLVVGPWIHGPGNVGKRQVGELDFGPEASFDLFQYRLRWYDYWLKGIPNGIMDDPPVQVFLMGANHWLHLNSWPPSAVDYCEMYFHEGTGRNEASLNNGRLSFHAPDSTERPDSFLYDPADPVPSLITYPELGPMDHRPVEGRMLTYTSDVLESDLTIVGPVRAVIYGLSTAPDTDWVVRLCDVWPDGRSLNVCDGILRARYWRSLERPELLVPGQIYRFEIDLLATAQVFKAGHRVRVEVTSSDFPRYDRNLNTGGPFGEEIRGQVAVNTVFHDAMRPSHILLPVMR